MREQLQARLKVLQKEFETGQARLRELDLQQAVLRETLFRISGAIQVLEELLAGNGAGPRQDAKAIEGEVAAASRG
jgi:predicted nuclease with TOPRIM domain